jgi:hypothetical protein
MVFIDNKYTKWYYSIIKKASDRVNIGYTEKHHIIPECFYISRFRKGPIGWLEGNPNDAKNIVKLTAKEHFICHLLLPKMLTGIPKAKMVCALIRFVYSKKYNKFITARSYANIKTMHSEAISLIQKGVKTTKEMSESTRKKISAAKLGKPFSEIHKQNMRKPKSDSHKENMKGREITEETRNKLRASKLGKSASSETRKKQSDSALNRPPVSLETKHKLKLLHEGKPKSEDHKIKLSQMQTNLPMLCCLHCGNEINKRVFTRYHLSQCNKPQKL